jgi:hypothetical protein
MELCDNRLIDTDQKWRVEQITSGKVNKSVNIVLYGII